MKVLVKSAWGSDDPTKAAFRGYIGEDNFAWDTHPCLRGVLTGRGVLDAALERKYATFANPSILVGLIEWADKLLTE